MEEQVWTSQQIKDLISYAKELQSHNEDLRAKIIAMDAMLKNEMAKTKQLKLVLKKYII